MRAETVKRLAILIVVLSLVGGTGYFAHAIQLDKNARSRVKRAELAEKEGNFAKAERLYQEYLEVVPEDVVVQIKYADALLKVDKSPKGQGKAFQIYSDIVKRFPGEDAWRRRLMQLKIDRKQFNSGTRGDGADLDLDTLLKTSGEDGNLHFLRGQCYEDAEDYKKADSEYETAIKDNAPQRIEACQRRAILLRDKLKEPKKAEELIEAMVQSDPENYQVYLARGRYYLSHPNPNESSRMSFLKVARDDFQKARQRASEKPEVYLEIARTFGEDKSGRDEVRQILEEGLKKAPKSMELYQTLADLEVRADQVDKAIQTLEDGVKWVPEPSGLHWFLAKILAGRGDTDKLRLQIDKLETLGFSPLDVKYLTGCYYLNSKDFLKARQNFLSLQGARSLTPDAKVRINVLLAQCYSQLNEPDQQQAAYRRALSANPQDLAAKQGVIENLVNQGAIEEAIKEYQALVKRAPVKWAPHVRLRLADLLIARNRRRPEPRDWSEVKRLIDDAAEAAPASVDPVILRAQLLLAQDKAAEAQNVLEKARSDFPKSSDQVELRLARARLWAIKGGPQVVTVLNDLAQNIKSFSPEERHKLLEGLAVELLRQQDLQGAIRLLSQLAEENPNDLKLRLTLLDLAFQTDSRTEIEKNIKEIERIEGSEGLQGLFSRVHFLIWQAEQGSDKKKQKELRTSARKLLDDLISRRGDWSVIPLAQAQLEEQELKQGGLKEDERQIKEASIVRFYLQAIKLGQRDSAVVGRAVQLLFKHGRGGEALEILNNNIPVESPLAGYLGRQAEQFALDNRDFQRAVQIARKAVAANPGDFQERFRLVQILLHSGHQADAEVELRKAVDLSKSDPERWINLVGFMVFTNQSDKAEQAIRDAEKNLPQSQAPLALAQCCELVGGAYETKNTDDAMKKKWYAEAKKWYEKAQAAQPDDLSIQRRLTQFFLDTKQMDEAKSRLNAIRKKGTGAKAAGTVAWARRKLALVLASDADYRQVRQALSLFEPNDQPVAPGQEGKTLEDPEDRQILARVLDLQARVPDVQRIPQYRKRAIEILESLTNKNLANSEDRFLLAGLYELGGDWPKAREKYQDLILRTRNIRNMETLKRRPWYLDQFAESLLRHRHPGEEQDLANAQELVDELKQLQPNALRTLVLQVEIDQAHNQPDSAAKRIEECAERPNLTPEVLEVLANLAEKLGKLDLAEKIYRQLADRPAASRGKIMLAAFLGRHGHVKEVLDICEPLWATRGEVDEGVVDVCFYVVSSGKAEPDRAQLDRVSGWLERALAQSQNDRLKPLLWFGLANIRDRQELYEKAEDLYQRIVKLGNHNGVAPSPKLIATSCNNLAWLMALKDGKQDGKGREALDHIKRAITLGGPDPGFLDTRGVVYLTADLAADNSQRAIDDLEKAVKLDPSPSKYFHLAQAYLADKKREKAKQSLAEANKTKGWEQSGVHPLEKEAYQKVLNELGSQ